MLSRPLLSTYASVLEILNGNRQMKPKLQKISIFKTENWPKSQNIVLNNSNFKVAAWLDFYI